MKKSKIIGKITALIVICILGLSYCSDSIKEGEITKKWYEPESTIMMLMPITISNGKSFSTMMVPMWIHDDEDFVIQITAYNEKKEKFQTKTLYLTEELYNSIFVGDYFVQCVGCDDNDPDIKKRAEK
jgi:hypothetical protein